MTDWAGEILSALRPIALRLDGVHQCADYSAALDAAVHSLCHPDTLPSARVLAAVQNTHNGSFVGFVRAQSQSIQQTMLNTPLPMAVQAHFEQLAQKSWNEQRQIEAADDVPFDQYLQAYLSPERLVV